MATADDLHLDAPAIQAAATAAPAGIRLQLIGAPCLLRAPRGDPDDAAETSATAGAAAQVSPHSAAHAALATHVLERRDAALLALLAIEGSTSRARVISLLWPDSDARRGGNSLRQRLFRLKRWAGCDVVVGDRSISLSGSVRVLQGVQDMQVHHGVPVGQPSMNPGAAPEGAAADSLADIDLSNGADLLGTLYYGDCGELAEWVDRAREQQRAARRRALADAASRLEAEGRLAEALELAERLLRDEPATEQAHRRVMQLHYLRGDRAAALGAFERCVRQLKREFKAQPGRETLQLAKTIERSDDLPARAALSHALSQLQPQRPSPSPAAHPASTRAPALGSPARRPQSPGLPMTLRRPPRLVGRDAEWRWLEGATSRGRAVWVTGEAGVGKSRLLADFAQARRWPAPTVARPGDEGVPYALLARWLDSTTMRFGALQDRAIRQELALLLPRLANPYGGTAGASAGDVAGHTTAGMVEPARILWAIEAALAEWLVAAVRANQAVPGIVLDDLQFADAASLALIRALAASGHAAPTPLGQRATVSPSRGAESVGVEPAFRRQAATASALVDGAIDPVGLKTRGWIWLLGAREFAGIAPAGVMPADSAQPPQEATSSSSSSIALRLKPLPANDVTLLLDSLQLPGLDAAAWTAPVLAQCGGNPGFILDALALQHAQGRYDFSAGPQAVAIHSPQRQSAIESCLNLVPAAVRQLAQIAAVAGADFAVELAAAVVGCAPVALAPGWRALQEAGLFDDGGFVEGPARQTALASVPQAIRGALHRQVARWLAEAGGAASGAMVALPPSAASGSISTVRVAAHCEAAQDWALAASAYETSAAQARARSARREELEALMAAARCHRAAAASSASADDAADAVNAASAASEPNSVHTSNAAHSQAAFDCDWRAVHLLISLESADVALAHADALLQCAAGTRQRAAALEARARVLGERFEPEAALADARLAVELAQAANAPRLQLLATQRAAAALMRLARPDEAVAAHQAWRDTLDPLEDEERLFWLSDHATALDYADRRTEAVEMFDRAIAQAERLAHWTAASEAWGNKAIALMYLNRMHESMQASQRAIECGQRAGSEHGNLLIDEMTLAGSLRDLGQFDAYLARAEALPQALRDVGYPVWAFNAENDLAVCFLWLGRPELAQQALSAMPDDLPPMMRASRLFTQARLARGRPVVAGEPGAAQFVRRAHELLTSAGGTGRSYVRLKVALELARDADPAEALERVRAIEAEALQREQFMLAMQALVVHTEMLTGLNDPRAAIAGGQLMDRCLRDGPPPGAYAPEVWWVAHAALAVVDPVRARSALVNALAWIEETAGPRIPAVFRASFLERNPVNVAVRAAAVRLHLRTP